MKKYILLLLTTIAFSQNPTKNVAGFYAGAATMNPSAIGQFDSTAKGFLFPRMTTTQRNAIVSPATSLVIFNTTTGKYNFYTGSVWSDLNPTATLQDLGSVLDEGNTALNKSIVLENTTGSNETTEYSGKGVELNNADDGTLTQLNSELIGISRGDDSTRLFPDGIKHLDSGGEHILNWETSSNLNGTVQIQDPLSVNEKIPFLTQSISNGDTKHSPSGDAVFDALATKGSGTVTNVSGTTNRVTVATGTTTPVIDISATFEALLSKISNRIDQNNATTTSAQFGTVISNETGTGNVVFSDSPTFSGTPNAPTQSANDNTTKIATTAYADAKVVNNMTASTTEAPSKTAVINYFTKGNLGLVTTTTDNAISRYDGTGGNTQNSGVIIDDDGGITLPGQASPVYGAKKIVYDTANNCFTAYNDDANVALQIGQEIWIPVRNVSGSTIPNGSAVYINGASSGMPTIALAQANSGTTTVCAGLTTEAIANNSNGFVTSLGLVRGLDTSSFAVGNIFLSSTVAGGLTQTAPSAPNFRYRVGFVTAVNATTGAITVTPTTAALGNGTANQVFGMNSGGTAQEVKSIVGGTGISVAHTANTITVNSLVASRTQRATASVTGVIVPTIAFSLLIPANTYAATDAFEIIVTVRKSTTATAVNYNLYHDTTINGTGNAIATAISFTSANRAGAYNRFFDLAGGIATNSQASTNTSMTPYVASGGVASTTTFNPAVNQYFTLQVSGHTVSGEVSDVSLTIRPLK